MTAPTILPADLLAQIGDLITATQTVSADAEKWRELLRKLRDVGYGPQLSPDQIAYLIPSARYVAEIAAASQEVPAASAAPKSAAGKRKRRIITDHDREIIHRAHADGINVQAICVEFGYSKSTIERTLHPTNGDGA
jgi:hypothetical protein